MAHRRKPRQRQRQQLPALPQFPKLIWLPSTSIRQKRTNNEKRTRVRELRKDLAVKFRQKLEEAGDVKKRLAELVPKLMTKAQRQKK